MPKRVRLIRELTENCWAMLPEQYFFMLSFLKGSALPDKLLAEEMRSKMEVIQHENSSTISDTGIAYIPVMGTVYPRSTRMTQMCGGCVISDLQDQLNTALDNSNVKGIVLDIDGPGGAVTGTNEFANALYEARNSKPVYGYVGGTAASATYWISSAVSKLFVDETARLGSVGTVIGVPKKNDADEYVEITNSLSPYKRPDPANEEHYSSIVKTLDDITEVFYGSLCRNRGVERSFAIENFGKGGMKVGKNAINSRMADEIGSFSSTVEALISEISGVKSEKFIFDGGANSRNYCVDTNSNLNVKPNLSEETGGKMNIAELKEKHPNLVAELNAEFSANSAKEVKDAIAEVAGIKDAEISGLKEKVLALETENAEILASTISTKKSAANVKADSIFSAKISGANIPESFHGKVKKQVSAAAFISESGDLNEADYSAAVDQEISEWESSFSGKTIPSKKEVLGAGTEDDQQEKNSDEKGDNDVIARLLNFVK